MCEPTWELDGYYPIISRINMVNNNLKRLTSIIIFNKNLIIKRINKINNGILKNYQKSIYNYIFNLCTKT